MAQEQCCLLHFETFLLLSAAPSSTGINRKTDRFSKRNIPGLAFRLIGAVFLPPFLGHRKVRVKVISPSRSHRSSRAGRMSLSHSGL